MTRSPGYDLWVERDSDTFGLMLVDDKSKGLLYRDSHAPTVNPNVSPTEADYTAFPTYIDWPIAQTTFHGGFGKLVHNKKYPVRYGESVGWDPRKENELKLFPTETSETVTLRSALTTASFTNLDFESDGTGWTKSAVTGADCFDCNRVTEKKAGTYGWQLEVYKKDSFTADNWSDAGANIAVHTAGGHLDFIADNAAGDDRCTLDMTAVSDTVWTSDFDLSLTGQSGNDAVVYIGAFSASENITGMAGDAILVSAAVHSTPPNAYSLTLRSINGGAPDATSTSVGDLVEGTIYYVRIQRTSATAATLNVFTDAGRTTHATGSPQSIVVSSGVAGLRYFQVSNATGADTDTITGVIDNWTFRGAQTPLVTIYQDLSPWGSYYNNKAATFTCYGKTSLATNLYVGMSFDGGSSTSYGTACGTTNDWTDQMTWTATPVTAATGIRLVIKRASTAYSGTDYIDVAAFSQPAASRGTPLKIDFKWGTDYYYIENKTLFKWSTNQYLEAFNFEDAVVDAAIYKNRMVISVGTDDFLYYSGAGTDATWTRSANVPDKVGLMEVVGGTLWGVTADAKVVACTDITSGTWTSGSSIGDSSVTITGLREYNGTLYVGKQDNVYVLTISTDLSYTSTAIAPRFKGSVSSGNFKQMKVADALILCHNTGVHEWDYPTGGSATLTNISPVMYGPTFTDYQGAAKAIAVGQEWAWLILEPTGSNTKSKVMAMRLGYIADAENPTDYRWHSIAEVDLDEVYDAAELNSKLLVCGTKSSTAAVKSFSIYSTSSYPDNNAAGVKCEFRIDNATSWTELNGSGTGSFDAAAGETIAFQANQSGKRIQFKLSANAGAATFITPYYDGGLPGETKSFKTLTLTGETFTADGTSATPVIRGMILRCVLRTPPLRTIWAVVRVDDDIVNHAGISDKIPSATLKAYIDALFTEADAITLYDIHGVAFTCHVLPDGRGEFDVGYSHDFNKITSKYELYFQQARTS
ncbi:MAG: hypothetical protein PHV74_11890 [Dehalococcoidia bacterium]|nr:hypothetical protein [Dehalococcoidia bacterium]